MILISVEWQFRTDFLGHSIGPIFKDQTRRTFIFFFRRKATHLARKCCKSVNMYSIERRHFRERNQSSYLDRRRFVYLFVCLFICSFVSSLILCRQLSSWHGMSSCYGWRTGLQIWKIVANIWNKL